MNNIVCVYFKLDGISGGKKKTRFVHCASDIGISLLHGIIFWNHALFQYSKTENMDNGLTFIMNNTFCEPVPSEKVLEMK